MENTTTSPGSCPKCHEELQLTEGALPERCPACSKRLRPANYGFLACVSSGLRQYCTWRGRATRAEYWWFCLFEIICYELLSILHSIANGVLNQIFSKEAAQLEHYSETIATFSAAAETIPFSLLISEYPLSLYSSYHLSYAAICLFFLLLNLFFFLPSLAVTVRRMHDTGASAISVILVYIGKIGIIVGVVMWVWGIISKLIDLPADQCTEEVALNAIINPWLGILPISFFLLFISMIYVLVHLFFDSQRGPNKYGPSAKYPLG